MKVQNQKGKDNAMIEVMISVSISLLLNAALLRIYELHMQDRFLKIYQILLDLMGTNIKTD